MIERVSTLFRGQPSLIQGFNTFLPPGYRIECSLDPNEGSLITVTTPNGTTTQSLGGAPIQAHAAPLPGAAAPAEPAVAPSGAAPSHEYAERAAPPIAAHSAPGLPVRNTSPAPLRAAPAGTSAPAPVGVPPYPGRAAPPSYDMMGRGAVPPAPGPPAAPLPSPMETAPRPPVEFNHAINYVNKIKQRFGGDPDTYKQFLEILQTYQKEQRPIHEVYAQVTVLFDHAKDLLEEFKQFLPDTGAAVPGAGGGGLFNMLNATNGMGESGAMPPGAAPPGAAPPVAYDAPPRLHGHAPPPAALPTRKKRAADEAAAVTEAPVPRGASHRKRTKKGTEPPGGGVPPGVRRAPPPGAPYMMPGEAMGEAIYAPGAAAPMAPGYEPVPPQGYLPAVYPVPGYAGDGMAMPPPVATMDEVSFFERVKKHLDDRAVYLDFLKLLHLYAQDVLDVGTLVDRASLFLGGRPDLMSSFKALCGYDMGRHGWLEQQDPVLENVPALERKSYDLSSQKSCGPSYRKLPDSEVNLSCSGRDALCWEVLNDGWVSYPTWASEGESFNPHKKNVYEDALYRSEEERHEYDYHIEANLRTIALLEPLAARIAAMNADERAQFHLKPGLGGQSKSIYQRIIKKVYGRDHGVEVMAALHENPCVAVPVVLARLKQKDEEWKRAQREWNKVWREVDARNFYKALDHQGVTFKSTDKKATTPKALVQDIETLHAAQQQRRLALDPSLPRLAPRFQLAYELDDVDVLGDVLQLLTHYLERPVAAASAAERTRTMGVWRSLLGHLWQLPAKTLDTLLVPRARLDAEAPDARSDSADESTHDSPPPPGPQAMDTWHMDTSSVGKRADAPPPCGAQMFANTTLYVWVRLFQLLYARLERLKRAGAAMAQPGAKWTKVNPLAADLGLADTATGPAGLVATIAAKLPGSHASVSDADQAVLQLHPSQFYGVTLELITRLIDGEMDQATFEEAVRFMYTRDGYVIYTFDKLMQALTKASLALGADVKGQALLRNLEATPAAAMANASARRDVDVFKQLMAARMHAEQVVGKDEPLFRVEVVPRAPDAGAESLPPSDVRIQLLEHDDLTLEDPLDAEQRWMQYIASYCLWAPTEGLPATIVAPVLQRNLPPSPDAALAGDGEQYLIKNGLDIRVCMKTYRLFYVRHTEDVWARLRPAPPAGAAARHETARRQRFGQWLETRHRVMASAASASAAEPPAPAADAPPSPAAEATSV